MHTPRWLFAGLLSLAHFGACAQLPVAQVSSCPCAGRYGASSFAIDDRIYVVAGTDGINNFNDLWVYDVGNDAWMQRADLPAPARRYGAASSVNGYGYFGTGETAPNDELRDWWRYDPASDSWAQMSDLGITAGVRLAVAVAFNGQVHLGTGSSDNVEITQWNIYTPTTNSWATIGGPYSAIAASAFATSDRIIVTGGRHIGIEAPIQPRQLDPTSGVWTDTGPLPFGNYGRSSGVGFTYGQAGYMSHGWDGVANYPPSAIAFDPATLLWSEEPDLAMTGRRYPIGGNFVGGVYVGMGQSGTTPANDLWLILDEAVGTAENQRSAAFSVFPNPTTGPVHLRSRQAFTTATVMDLSGRPILAEIISDNELNLGRLEDGIYTLQLRSAQGTDLVRVVIRH